MCSRDYEEAGVLGTEERMKEMMGDKVGGRVGRMLCLVGHRAVSLGGFGFYSSVMQ